MKLEGLIKVISFSLYSGFPTGNTFTLTVTGNMTEREYEEALGIFRNRTDMVIQIEEKHLGQEVTIRTKLKNE